MRIYEIFRRTKESYICSQINIDGLGFSLINIDIFFFKHMLEQFIINSFFDINIVAIGDLYVDYHHITEDIGICLGLIFKLSILNKKFLCRYGYSYIALDESLSRVVIDISGRSYLNYNPNFLGLYLGNFNVDLFYDFFYAFCYNSNIVIHILNLYGYSIHHIIESIFKSFGKSLRMAINIKKNLLFSSSTKGILF